MDSLTHLLIAYSLICWVKWFRKIPNKFLIPYLIGAVIPDLDVILNGLAYFFPQLYWLEHRAMGHSLVGVIPFVLISAALLNIPKVKNLIWKDDNYPDLKFWSPIGLLAMYIGSLAHLLADFFVPTGIMLFFPFSLRWYGVRLLSTLNIQTIAAVVTAVSFWPLKWNKRRRNITLSFFIIVFTFYSSVRIASNMRSSNLFQDKYGSSQYSSHEYIYTWNLNYNIYNDTDLNNKTYIFATIDGIQKEFISEELIPELRFYANQSDFPLLHTLINLTRENWHYYRLWQKNQIVCAEVSKESNSSWIITWFAPIREIETNFSNNYITIGSSTRVTFHIQNDGNITKVIRPLSV
ncbi:MAG: metal-dependent hydrolase [Asgard group archaeon]|nr:metal-dependent hydrolase [Asgard group archaeon]